MSIDGLQGSTKPFDARIHDARGVPGPVGLREKPRRSARRQRHQRGARQLRSRAGRLFDALRCPGARRRARRLRLCAPDVRHRSQRGDRQPDGVRRHAERSCRAATSTARRWHLRADVLCLGLVQLATISERRSERLVNPALSGLPAFLTRHGGLQSGLMMAQVTAAALTSELKTLAHPAGADTIPTSGNKEDHVSMSMSAGLKAHRALELARMRRRGRTALRVSGDRSARAARARRRRSRECMISFARASRRSTPIARRRAISRRLQTLIASGQVERACAMKVK